MEPLKGKRVTVMGLGRFGGGTAVARFLVEQGARVLVTDRDPAEKLAASVAQLDGLPIEFRLGEHRVEDFTSADLVVASPAVYPTEAHLAAARAAGVPITTEVRLFVERCPATILGVTGTKGKSTTSAMLAAVLRTRFTTHFGGNIGGSLLADLPRIGKTDLVVLELSSYMLHYLAEMRWSPHVAVVTMVAADHVEWHGGLDGYVAAKRAIVAHQRPDDVAVLNEADAASRAFGAATRARVAYFGVEGREPFDLRVPGRHNQLNAQAAFAAAQVVGVGRDDAAAALAAFEGLPHRLQLVNEARGVRYFNDSIATIPEAAVAALDAFPARKVIQIVGGSEHGLPITAMCGALGERAKAVLCVGQTGQKLADAMAGASHANAAPVYVCGDLPTAMTMARQVAASGDVVLLSTGFKSYDQFANFTERGEAFTKLAKEAS